MSTPISTRTSIRPEKVDPFRPRHASLSALNALTPSSVAKSMIVAHVAVWRGPNNSRGTGQVGQGRMAPLELYVRSRK